MNDKISREYASIEDLIWDEGFRQWVLNESDGLNEYWSNWILTHQDRIEDIVAAKEIVRSMSVKEIRVSDMEIDEAIQNIFANIEHQPGAAIGATDLQPKKSNWFKYAGIAASLLILMSVTILLATKNNIFFTANYKDLAKEPGSELTEQVNNGPALKQIILADGSRITLQKDARVSFNPKFNDFSTRKVYLNGKATFEVTKNPEKPFFVYTNGIVTKVLGTKFTINSKEKEKNITVEVISGIVSVSSLSGKTSQNVNSNKVNSLLLTRNQKANFSKEEKTLISSVVEQPVALNEPAFNYALADEPIKKIFKDIVENYGIDVIYDEKVIANRTFTADLTKTTLYQKLDIICKAINARYEILDGKIVVYTNTLQKNDLSR